MRSALAFLIVLLVATQARASDAALPGMRPMGINPGTAPVSLTGRLTGTFDANDVILGDTANVSVTNSQNRASELTHYQLQVSPGYSGLVPGYYLTLDSANQNAYSASLYTSSLGYGTSNWLAVGYVQSGAAGFRSFGLVAHGTSVTQLILWELSAEPICFGTNDTERGCWLAGGGLKFDESSAPTPAASTAILFDDSSTHTEQLTNNGDTPDPVARNLTAIATSDVTNATTTPTTITSVALDAAGKYACEAQGVLSESVAGDGFQVVSALAAGSATSASIGGELYDAAGLHASGEAASSALTLSDTNASTGHYVLHYAIVVNAAATWTVSTAQQSHTTGTLTTRAGATALCTRM